MQSALQPGSKMRATAAMKNARVTACTYTARRHSCGVVMFCGDLTDRRLRRKSQQEAREAQRAIPCQAFEILAHRVERV